MYSLLESNQALQNVVNTLWSDYQGKVFFEPVVDTEYGDVVSSCPQQLGRFLKKSPSEIAKKIIAELPKEIAQNCHFAHDFLNLSLDLFLRSWDERKEIFSSMYPDPIKNLVIILPPFSKYLPRSDFFRLSGVAVTHLLLAKLQGIDCKFWLGKNCLCSQGEDISLKIIYDNILKECMSPGGLRSNEIRVELESLIDLHEGMNVCLWLAPSSLEKSEFNKLYHSKIVNNVSVILRCPPRAWLDGCDDLSDLSDDFSSWDENSLATLSLYLSSPKMGHELQLLTSKFNESDNYLWLMKSLLIRLGNCQFFRNKTISQNSRTCQEKINWVYKKSVFLHFFQQDAVKNGKICDYVKALGDFLYSLLETIGDPKIRIEIEKGILSQVESQILTGAELVLSDIVSLWSNWLK